MATPKKKTASTGGTGTITKGNRGVEYPVEAVEEMEEEITTPTNKARYRKLMEPLTEQVGQLFKLAVFVSDGGARRVAGQMRKGKTEVPGDPNDWEFKPIKAKINDAGDVGSILYVKYLGEGGGPEQDTEEE